MTSGETSEATEARLRAAMPDNIERRVQSVKLAKGRAIVVADAGDMRAEEREVLEVAYKQALKDVEGVEEVHVALTGERKRMRIVAIGSGKGGVGKSTLTANIAVALARQGHKVGVVDGDIYGPSQPKLLATENRKPEARGDRLVPLTSPYGVKVLSMGHVAPAGRALAWRGPMAGKALGQLVEADWEDTDLLLIDLPPGTGDVQLSMMQEHKPDGAVLVSTPQDLALIDAARAGQLFEQGEVPIIGLVENMAGYECPHCGEVSDPFGSGGVEKFAAALDIPFLGRVPLRIETRVAGDAGKPPAATDGEAAVPFDAIAQRIAAWLSGEEY